MFHSKVCIHVLLSRSPVALAGPLDLHAGIHVTSVHPELGSNSQKNIEMILHFSKHYYIILAYIRNNFKKLIFQFNMVY